VQTQFIWLSAGKSGGLLQTLQYTICCHGNVIPIQAWTAAESSKSLMLQEFADYQYKRVVKLTALCTSHLYLPEDTPGYRLSQPQGHSAAGRIESMKNRSEFNQELNM
jgi:hypothetical protein